MRCVSLAIVLAVLGGGSAWAQEEADAHRTAVSVVGGFSVGSSRGYGREPFGFHDSGSGFVAGGGIAHDLSPRLTLEANGLYVDRGASAWSADAGLRVNLRPSHEGMVPYLGVSGGLYGEGGGVRREVDVPEPRGYPPGRPGQFGRDAVPRPPATVSTVTVGSRTDGMMTLGGGVRFNSGPHVFVRPDARAQVVFGGNTRVLGLFTLNFGYRF
jgi:hypothetical protein